MGTLSEYYNKYWRQLPWIRAAGIVVGVLGGLFLIIPKLFNYFKIDIADANFAIGLTAAILVCYFFLVAILTGEQLDSERRLRSLEDSFRYDNRGTLFNGTEPNIAFRIPTFKGILAGLAAKLSPDIATTSLIDTGKAAAENFSKSLPSIYDSDIQKLKGGRTWTQLSCREKIDRWMDYDSHTGWGILTARLSGSDLQISVTHLGGLFNEVGGHYFASFLAGYCSTMIQSIIASEKDGPYQDYSTALLQNIEVPDSASSDGTVQLSFRLS